MLVILSDLHLTDGTSCETLDPGAFRIFAERLQDLAVRASWRADGHYRPIPQIDILLLGDAVDLMRSSRWLIDGPKPWSSVDDESLAERVDAITSGILTHNLEAAAVLKGLSERSTIRVPAMSADGRPRFEHDLQAVPVHLHYMVGDADWPLHLPGETYNHIRRRITTAWGLSTDANRPFPHEMAEDPKLQAVLRQHRVLARHGDVFDRLSFSGQRDQASFNDLLQVAGLMRFRFEVQHGLAAQLPPSAQLGLQELDHVRPLVLAPIWLLQMMKVSCPITSLQYEIKNCWDRIMRQMLHQARQLDQLRPWGIKDLDALDDLLCFERQDTAGWRDRLLEWLRRQGRGKSLSLAKHALDEADFRNRRARHLVFGHTHCEETIPLDASFADGYVLSQTYFNSGTWRRVYTPTAATVSGDEFLPAEKMTYLTFYRDDERQGALYEVWNGMLGSAPSPVRRIRFDPSQSVLRPNTKRPIGEAVPRPTPHRPHAIPSPPAVPSTVSPEERPRNTTPPAGDIAAPLSLRKSTP